MRNIIMLSLVSLLSACSALDNASKLFPPEQTLATKMVPLESFKELKALPKPKGAIPVSVYAYRDQTGQYKPQANVSSFSTAVTQGATSILMQALSDSDWFLPVEREGLQNVLTERKITRAAHQANKRIIDATANRIDLDEDKVMMNIHKYGNTTSATLPLLINDYESQLKKGDNINVFIGRSIRTTARKSGSRSD